MMGDRRRKALSGADVIVLNDILDWRTPQEVACLRGYRPGEKASSGYGRMLSRLTVDGLAQHREADHRFCITEAGRQALSHHNSTGLDNRGEDKP